MNYSLRERKFPFKLNRVERFVINKKPKTEQRISIENEKIQKWKDEKWKMNVSCNWFIRFDIVVEIFHYIYCG